MKPNIVLILIDDMGWRDLGCYGSSFYETPNIDRLAAGGARFTDAYAAAPVCSPTRASLLSGKYPAHVGMTAHTGSHSVGRLRDVPSLQQLPSDEISLARALREAGYRTWHVGKWHLGTGKTAPERHGFDINVGGSAAGAPPSYFSPYGLDALTDGPEGEYLTDRLTDEAIRLIEEADDGSPFFLNLWHYAVHVPIQAPPELVEKYAEKAVDLRLHEIDPFEVGEVFPVWHKREQRVRRRLIQSDPAYAAMVENLDTNVGRLMDALARSGKGDNTVVVFTSDNGGLATAEGSPTSNAPLSEGKGWLADGGIREPLIISWPGRIAEAVVGDVTTTPDLYPTLLEVAGHAVPPTQEVDGVSLLPLLTSGTPLADRAVYWHYPHYSNQGGGPAAGVRQGPWKLVRLFESESQELFNLETDPGESNDLFDVDRAIAEHLSASLDRWLTEMSALFPQRSAVEPFWDSISRDDKWEVGV